MVPFPGGWSSDPRPVKIHPSSFCWSWSSRPEPRTDQQIQNAKVFFSLSNPLPEPHNCQSIIARC